MIIIVRYYTMIGRLVISRFVISALCVAAFVVSFRNAFESPGYDNPRDTRQGTFAGGGSLNIGCRVQ